MDGRLKRAYYIGILFFFVRGDGPFASSDDGWSEKKILPPLFLPKECYGFFKMAERFVQVDFPFFSIYANLKWVAYLFLSSLSVEL